MPRKPLIRSKVLPYHVTARGNNREPFPCDLQEVWDLCITRLTITTLRYESRIHAFVLMPNHFHLLVTTPKNDLGVVMQDFMQSVTKTLNWRCGRSGRIFGGRYHQSLIDSMNYYDCALKYVYRNPVKANILNKVEDYPFSTIKNIYKNSYLPFELKPALGNSLIIPNGLQFEFLDWLNEPFQTEQEEEIRKGLKKTMFSPSKFRDSTWKKQIVALNGFDAAISKK